ncbi:MAG: 4Fe-4S dicluster domain-containing protein [Bacteroidales bacterium]|nr:4Fe-4S dicluster domain-containing protein [Bacteroidales bacterium]
MIDYIERLNEDYRFCEGLKACMNCGMCTAICPAAAVFDYDPRKICQIMQKRDNALTEQLLASDMIWYCGQCIGCRTRCPRNNTPGYIIQALRKVSLQTGLYLKSAEGRKQIKIAKTVGENLLTKGYCVDIDLVKPEMHPEQGPMWEWVYANRESVCNRCGGNYHGDGAGAQRKLSDETKKELFAILRETGGESLIRKIQNAE